MKKIKLDIVGLSYSQTQSGAYALVLGEAKGKRRLPIIKEFSSLNFYVITEKKKLRSIHVLRMQLRLLFVLPALFILTNSFYHLPALFWKMKMPLPAQNPKKQKLILNLLLPMMEILQKNPLKN